MIKRRMSTKTIELGGVEIISIELTEEGKKMQERARNMIEHAGKYICFYGDDIVAIENTRQSAMTKGMLCVLEEEKNNKNTQPHKCLDTFRAGPE